MQTVNATTDVRTRLVNNAETATSFFELPFLSTHWAKLIDLLRIQPFYDAVNVKAV